MLCVCALGLLFAWFGVGWGLRSWLLCGLLMFGLLWWFSECFVLVVCCRVCWLGFPWI